MATPNTENPVHHLISLLRIARFSLLAGLLAFGSAHAADISVSFRDGALTARQEFAGTGYHSIALVNDSDQLATFSVARLQIGASVADYKTANDALMEGIDGSGGASLVVTVPLQAPAHGRRFRRPRGMSAAR